MKAEVYYYLALEDNWEDPGEPFNYLFEALDMWRELTMTPKEEGGDGYESWVYAKTLGSKYVVFSTDADKKALYIYDIYGRIVDEADEA